METIYKKVKARKAHTCFGCCGAIIKGENVFYATTFSDGKVRHAYLCKTCDAVISDPNGFDEDDFFIGEIKEKFPELWEKHRKRLEEKVENA